MAWSEQAQLTAVAPEANDGFGWSVAVSGETIVVGVPFDNVVGDDNVFKEGSAYVFVRNGETWPQQALLTAAPDLMNDGSRSFGWSVAISGDTALVSAYPDETDAFVFSRSGLTWSPAQRLLTNPGEALTGDGFGGSVAITARGLSSGLSPAITIEAQRMCFSRTAGPGPR